MEISSTYRTALVPDFCILQTPPVGVSFHPNDVLLAGEIWSPGYSFREQQDKHDAYARAGVAYFWSLAQDGRGPTELVTYRLKDGRYAVDIVADLTTGPVTVTAAPGPVEVDVPTLRV